MKTRRYQWRRVGHRADAIGGVAGDGTALPFEVAEDDPLLLHLQMNPGTVAVKELAAELESPALEAMLAAEVEVVVPLVAQGQLIGVLNLGPRRSERPYNLDDRRLLDNLASNAAAAIRVAHLVRHQEQQARHHARIDQELRVAQLIQQQFLPQEAPAPEGWRVVPHYRPAREVGGDFYDFIPLSEGRIGFVVGDVTDKGVPAAMVMATTHSILRTDAPRLVDPGAVLSRANELLCAEMPPNMFVTCLYAVLDPSTGHLRFANAGHNLPCIRTKDGVVEPRATGMPLGLMPGITYEEQEVTVEPGSTVLLYSDGIVEAHDPSRELYGFPRIRGLVGRTTNQDDVVQAVLDDLADFTGPDWDQEDDITLVSISREASPASDVLGAVRLLTSFELRSDLGNERVAADRAAAAVAELGLSERVIERLRTVVAEAAMNAIEHGNGCRSDVPVQVQLSASPAAIRVRVTDQGGAEDIAEPELPDIDAKLAGEQTPRGWGLFLIKAMVDSLEVSSDGVHRSVELVIRLDHDEGRAQ
ncbi:MAG: ATP-binding SpoIIE family protein phosphatase [Actinomycetota bacterium]